MMKKKLKFLFVEMPFKNAKQPNLGLSILKKILTDSQFSCEILYANMQFAQQIGVHLYQTIAEKLPQELLIPDLIFSSILNEKDLVIDPLKKIKGKRDLHRGAIVPNFVWNQLDDIKRLANELIETLVNEIIKREVDVIGFSLMFHITPSLALAKRLKKSLPNVKIIIGGANCEGEMGLQIHKSFKFIDFVCRGEGETLINELACFLSNKGEGIENIKGLIWRDENDNSICNGDRAENIISLDSLPMPDYDDWVQFAEKHQINIRGGENYLPIETSRGCWYGEKNHCTFCGLVGESFAFRFKNSDRVIKELRTLSKYQIKNIFAVDLIFPNQYFDTLLKKLISEKIKFNFFYEVKANLSRKKLELFQHAGVVQLQPGIESLSTPILKLMKKGVSAYQNIRLLKWSIEYGLNIFWNILYGFPKENSSDYLPFIETIPLITHLRPPVHGCCKVRLDRFSPLFNKALEKNKKIVLPSKAYEMVYSSLTDEELKRIAYYFEMKDNTNEKDNDHILRLKEEVVNWHTKVGKSSFVSLNYDAKHYLFDRRGVNTEEFIELNSLESQLYIACDSGIRIEPLCKTLNVKESYLLPKLKEFCEKGYILEVDSRFLSLAVNMDNIIPNDIDKSILPEVVHSIYKHRILAMWESSTN